MKDSLNLLAKIVTVTFVAPVLGTFLGAVTAWMIGLFIGPQILHTLAAFGVKSLPIYTHHKEVYPGIQMWELGATLGFVFSTLASAMSVLVKR